MLIAILRTVKKFYIYYACTLSLFVYAVSCTKNSAQQDDRYSSDIKKITLYDVKGTDTFTRISYTISDTIAHILTINILDSILLKGAKKTYFFDNNDDKVRRIYSEATLNYHDPSFCDYTLCYDFSYTYSNSRLLPDYVSATIYDGSDSRDRSYGISGTNYYLGFWDEIYDYRFGGRNQTGLWIFVKKDSCIDWHQENETKYAGYFYENIPGLAPFYDDDKVSYLYDNTGSKITSCTIQFGNWFRFQDSFVTVSERKIDFEYNDNSSDLQDIMSKINPIQCLQAESATQFNCVSFPYTPQDFYKNICGSYTDSLFRFDHGTKEIVSASKYTNYILRDANGIVKEEKRSCSNDPNYFRYFLFE